MDEREFSSINVIPLVDIMLVLLTIVLTTATFVVQGEMKVNLPVAESGGERGGKEEVVVTIDREGRIYLWGREVDREGLREELKGIRRDRRVSLRADREARIEKFVEVMDILNDLGFRDLRMVVRKE